MAVAEICLNIAQILCVDLTLWIGYQNYGFVLETPAIYVFVTANQILFLFRYYLLVLIVIHRGIFIISQKIAHYIEEHVSYLVVICWVYVTLINVLYFPLGCIRSYDAPGHHWKVICKDESAWPIVVLNTVSSLGFSYIPHFTVVVNILIIIYLKYYRVTRNVNSSDQKKSTKFEYNMILQPLMLACVLAIEPICLFIGNVLNKIVDLPSLPEDAYRVFNYSMTYLSTLTNFVFYFICHRDMRRLMWNNFRKKNLFKEIRRHPSRTVTIEIIAKVN